MKIKNYFKLLKCGCNCKKTKKDLNLDALPHFTKEILDDFRLNVGRYTSTETGGMIGCNDNFNEVDLWVFDKKSTNTVGSFAYDVNEMTKYYHQWKEQGGTVVGFVHSHPIGYRRPSLDDIKLSLTLMNFFANDFFYMPIIQADKKGNFELLFYIVKKNDGRLSLDLLYTIEATDTGYEYYMRYEETRYFEMNRLKEKCAAAAIDEITNTNKNKKKTASNEDDYFSRLQNFYPDAVLNKVLIYVGCGGVRSEIVNMARNGFKNFILIDGDIVSPSNIATQGVYRNEMGLKKVDAIAEEIINVNPKANIIKVPKMLDDSFSDDEFENYLRMFPCRQQNDYLIHGMTDNHYAQARTAMLALKYGIPYIGAAMYEYGLGGEIIFTYPGVTPSCPRCMLRSRYEAYENGFVNDVTSAGCPTFATERLNTTIGFISIMLLMYKCAPDSPYNTMLDNVSDRNFVQIRMSPFFGEKLNISTFKLAFGTQEIPFTYFDETLWLPQHPDHPKYGEKTCKLCGGIGDLRELVNKWGDTRLTASC